LLALRAQHPLLRSPLWFAAECGDIESARLIWRTPQGNPMRLEDWHLPLGPALAGAGLSAEFFDANASTSGLCILFNPNAGAHKFVLNGGAWQLLFDSSDACKADILHDHLIVPARSLLLLARPHTLPTREFL
jgi:pullulanase/glycogen debranching enzyme